MNSSRLRRERGRGRKAGFTLAEVMIASLVFLMVSLAFTGALIGAMRQHYMAADYYRATCIARNRIQKARSQPFDNILMLAETATRVNDDGVVDTDGLFERTTIVTNLQSFCTEITVQVHFPLPLGGLSPQPVQVSTIIAYGM